MSVLKRLVNVATHRVRRLVEGEGPPHPGEAALDEELASGSPPVDPAQAERARPEPAEVEAPTAPRTRRL
jgi:hypothetical protein